MLDGFALDATPPQGGLVRRAAELLTQLPECAVSLLAHCLVAFSFDLPLTNPIRLRVLRSTASAPTVIVSVELPRQHLTGALMLLAMFNKLYVSESTEESIAERREERRLSVSLC